VQGLDNFLVEVHIYYDHLENSALAGGECTSGPKILGQMAQATDLLRNAGLKAIVGEFATNRKESCNKVAQDIANFAVANSDVWQGLVAWGGGAHYSPFATDPISLLPDPVFGDSPMLSQILGPLALGDPVTGQSSSAVPTASSTSSSSTSTSTSSSLAASATGVQTVTVTITDCPNTSSSLSASATGGAN
jgi:hypothetical protein